MADSTDKLGPAPLDILGVPVTPFDSYAEAIDCVNRLLAAKQKVFCVAINPEKIHRARHDARMMALLQQAQIRICDGVGAAIAARILHGRKVTRITGVRLFFELNAEAAKRQWKVFLLGASPQVNESAAARLTEKHPQLQIAGRRDGYFKDAEQVVAEINKSGADLLFVALGSPKQEEFIVQHREQLNPAFCMGIGGSLDVASGRVKWAPKFFRKTGTEWLYRLLCRPSRWRRQLALPLFLFDVLKAKLSRWQQRPKTVS